MVLHLGEQNLVASLDEFLAPGVCDQIDSLGGPARENNLLSAARVDKGGCPRSRAFEGVGGAVAQFVDAAMNVGVIMFIIAPQRRNHLSWFLRGRGIIKVDQGV